VGELRERSADADRLLRVELERLDQEPADDAEDDLACAEADDADGLDPVGCPFELILRSDICLPPTLMSTTAFMSLNRSTPADSRRLRSVEKRLKTPTECKRRRNVRRYA
jgi:hypothetical protein